MVAPPSAEEEKPAPFKCGHRFSIFFLLLMLLFIISCNPKKKEETPTQPVVDSIVLKKQQLQREDSLAKLTKPAIIKKKIYLTFDDGPNDGTQDVLNAVKEDSVPVSFFIVGKHAFDSPGQEATWHDLQADSSIEICNHSYTHALNHYTRYYSNPAGVVKDIQRNNEKLGLDNMVVRMPGRNAWRIDSINHTDIKESKAAIDAVHRAGFAIMGWDVEWMFDHKTLTLITDPDLLLRRIKNLLDAGKTRTTGHLVLLAHDQTFTTPSAIEQLHYLLRHLKNDPEYELVLAGSYPGVKNK